MSKEPNPTDGEIIANHLEWEKQMEKEIGDEAIKNFKDQLIEGLDKAVEKWSKEGRTPEQIYGARNFITSGHFIQLIKESGE